MDNIEDDARYPPNRYGVNQGYGLVQRPKLPVHDSPHSRLGDDQYLDGDDDDEEEIEEEEDGEGEKNNTNRRIDKVENDDDDDQDEDDENDVGESDDEDDEDDDKPNGSSGRGQDFDLERHQKKRKLKSLLSSYEFAPRVAPPTVVAAASPSKPSLGGRNSLTDWTERETFVLLDAWGDRFLKHGRKSLRSEEWQDIAEKVSEESKVQRTDSQCRNRVDTLKKKYKKEKIKFAETASTISKWVYFKKMNLLMSPTPQQQGLPCGVDSGEYVFLNPKVYMNRANGLDEMRDSPGNSKSGEAEEDYSDDLPAKRTKMGKDRDSGASFRLVANSIHKFSEIYEKIETRKRQQLLELEKMRMDFHRELELQKRQILERAQAEIAKIREGDIDENDFSAENVSG